MGCVSSKPRTDADSVKPEETDNVEQNIPVGTNSEDMGNSNKKAKKKEDAPSITVTGADSGSKGVKFAEPKSKQPNSETLEGIADAAAREAIVNYFTENGVEEKKLQKEFKDKMKKEFSIKQSALNKIKAELKASLAADEEEESTGEVDFSDEEEVEGEDALLKHPSKFPLHMLEGQYDMKKELGHGAFGVVSLALSTEKQTNLQPGTKVAIKKMLDIFGNPSGTKRLIRELRVLRYLSHHPSITQLLDVKIPKPHDLTKFSTILLVFECMDGDLSDHLKNPKIQYTEGMLRSIMKQIMTGLKYMHTAGFVHRDLKPQNLLVRDRGVALEDNRWQAKLCDFGLARCIHRNVDAPKIDAQKIFKEEDADPNALRAYKFQPKITKHVVTRYYRAPEISLLIQKREKLPAIDIWSVGCIMGELLQMIPGQEQGVRGKREILLKGAADLVLSPRTFHNRPIISKQQLNVIFKFLGTPSKDYINKIKNNDLRKWIQNQDFREPEDLSKRFKKVSPECLDFMRQMLHYDVEERYDIQQCIDHPWLQCAADDEMNMSHDMIVEDFEDVYLNDHQLRLMVVDEILHFNPRWRQALQLQYQALINKTKTNVDS